MDRVLLRFLVPTDDMFGIIRRNYSAVQLVQKETSRLCLVTFKV